MKALFYSVFVVVLLVAMLIGAGAQRKEHFTPDGKVDPAKLDRVIDDIYGHLQLDDLDDSRHASFTDTSRVDANGFDTVYIGFHFTSDQFTVIAMPSTVSMIAAVPLSDSSFVVALFEDVSTPRSDLWYRWRIEGQIR